MCRDLSINEELARGTTKQYLMYEDVAIQAVELVARLAHHDVRVLQIRRHILLAAVAVKPDLILLISEEAVNGFPAIVTYELVKLLLIHGVNRDVLDLVHLHLVILLLFISWLFEIVNDFRILCNCCSCLCGARKVHSRY